MDEQKGFFDRLFAGRIVWAMHTAMTCDLAYVKALMDKQQGDDAGTPKPQCAFFYDGNKQTALTCKMNSPKFSVSALKENVVFELNPDKTHHAKISLVCYDENGEKKYRLAVYSKNLEFSGNIDAALLFELEVVENQTSTPSGEQLCAYLDKLLKISKGKGHDWLENHPIKDKETLSKITLKSEFNRNAELYFGGCGYGKSLGSLLRLDQVSDKSIVLTPPFFIEGSKSQSSQKSSAQLFFEKKKILYDNNSKPSHIKLYLLVKPEKPDKQMEKNTYELWVGSANATPSGLGWDFNQFKENTSPASIECLVRFTISGDEFNRLSGNIEEYDYVKYTNFDVDSSLTVTPDEIGPYIVKNFKCKGILYDNTNQIIEVTLTDTRSANASVPNGGLSNVEWRPLEYSKTDSADFTTLLTNSKNGEIVIQYRYGKLEGKLKEAQGYLVFGSSCAMMKIPNELLEGIQLVKDKIEKDTRLTDWLLGKKTVPSEENVKWSERLNWIRGALSNNENLPAVFPEKAKQQKAQPMDFQKEGSKRLFEIMKKNSRAFLADEPGLGKTFTAAILVKKMADQYYEDVHNQGKPFYVIYVAPNKTLINKCCRDLVKKFNDVSQNREAILINDLVSTKETLNRAYYTYSQASNVKYGKFVGNHLDEINKIIDEYVINTKGTTISAIRKKIADKITNDLGNVPSWEQTIISYFNDAQVKYDDKLVDPDRLAYADLILSFLKKNGYSNSIEKKVVIIGVSAALSLGNSSAEYEKGITNNDRAGFTNAFLNTYTPRLIIWDEYHRYFNKLYVPGDNIAVPTKHFQIKNKQKLTKLLSKPNYHTKLAKLHLGSNITKKSLEPNIVYYNFETFSNSGLKSLFVSATPYQTNISGKEDKATIEKLYAASSKDLDESPDVELPSFKDFAKLFCGGKPIAVPTKHFRINKQKFTRLLSKPKYSTKLAKLHLGSNKISVTDVKKAYTAMAENGNKNALERYLKMRMIRNERTRLQGYYEEHIPLFNRKEQYDSVHAQILKNTAEQCRLLKEAGYSDDAQKNGALKWSFSLPWMLCFSTSRTMSKCKEKNKEIDTYYYRLNPNGKNLNKKNPNGKNPYKALFVYNDEGRPKGRLKTLPRQNLAMHQICKKNLPDRQAAQLLWMPPTIPLYKAGDNSIFTKYADYSKLLVFAEFRYLQRGGALLLSDYTRLLCKTKGPLPEFTLESKDIESFDFSKGDYRNKTLDEILKIMPGNDTVKKLYQLASPAACAKKLNLDSEKLTNAFNDYFNSSGVKEALWSWLCDNRYKDKCEEGILRYCAEGNLYAVLEEWLLCIKENDPAKQVEYIISILTRKHSTVGVQTHKTTIYKDNGIPRKCGFAEQLTGDVDDNGTGEDEENTRVCSQAFDSPFYPMILFAGRGAQEGIDMHNYCLRIMHLTLPRGAVSYEQRNGRIDRYRSLLVRRRAAEIIKDMTMNNTSNLIERAFAYLSKNTYPGNEKNNLYPNWSIKNPSSKWHFEELMPVWEYTEESCFADSVIEMLNSYRNSLGVNKSNDNNHIDLSTFKNDS